MRRFHRTLRSFGLPALVLATLALPSSAQPQDAEARRIFEEVEARQDDISSEAVVLDMDIVDDRGRTRSRRLRTFSRIDDDGDTRSLIVFEAPADIRGMGLLLVESDGEAEQQLYLPALRRVQRIAGAQRRDRFAGSDFSYEDLGSYNPDDFETRLVETTPDHWILEARSLDEDSQYSLLRLEVDRTRYVLLGVTYVDRDGEQIKRLTSESFVEVRPGIWRADRMVMEDLRDERKTVLTFREREVDASFSDDLFTVRQLRRGLP